MKEFESFLKKLRKTVGFPAKTFEIKPIMHVEKWSNILQKSWGVQTARFLKYIWAFFNMINVLNVI